MKRLILSKLSGDELVDRFAQLAVEQDLAQEMGEQSKVNRLYWKLDAIDVELKSRPGDERSRLLTLYRHPNMHVQLKAAKATLAVAPVEARRLIEVIAVSHHYPQAGEAGMTLFNLDRGVFKPT